MTISGENPPVWKDLSKLFKHFKRNANTYRTPGASSSRLGFVPNLDNTVLVEESAFKAHLQPYNHLPIKEFDLSEREKSVKACDHYDRSVLKEVGDDHHGALLKAIFQYDALDLYEKFVDTSSSNGSRFSMGIDGTLLGLVGILAEMQNIDSVPVWLAAGGLTPEVSRTFTREIASRGWAFIVRVDKGEEPFPNKLDSEPHVLPKVTLPGSEGYVSWYDSPVHLVYWIRRGIRALEFADIEIEHGMPRTPSASRYYR